MDIKRKWYLKNKDLVKERERTRREQKRNSPPEMEKRFIKFMASCHARIVRLIPKVRYAESYFYSQKAKKSPEERRKILKERKRKYVIEKYRSNVLYRLEAVLRVRLRASVKAQNTYKNNKTLDYIGCSKEELKLHLEKQFSEGMSWENFGQWHIDHKIPISRFDLSIEVNIHKAMHYSNLQPLWAIDNLRKSDK